MSPSAKALPTVVGHDRQFHQLPGQGEIITNVSLGDLTARGEGEDVQRDLSRAEPNG